MNVTRSGHWRKGVSKGWSARCTNCNETLSEDYRQPEIPCPHCGSIARAFFDGWEDKLEILEELEMKGHKGGGVSRTRGKLFHAKIFTRR
jgi:hypothetical protein